MSDIGTTKRKQWPNSKTDAIIKLLKKKPLFNWEIAESLNFASNVTMSALQRLKCRGIIKQEEGQYETDE